jgi:hypothetical protein
MYTYQQACKSDLSAHTLHALAVKLELNIRVPLDTYFRNKNLIQGNPVSHLGMELGYPGCGFLQPVQANTGIIQ